MSGVKKCKQWPMRTIYAIVLLSGYLFLSERGSSGSGNYELAQASVRPNRASPLHRVAQVSLGGVRKARSGLANIRRSIRDRVSWRRRCSPSGGRVEEKEDVVVGASAHPDVREVKDRTSELRNWVKLPDGRYQGEVYFRGGIADGKVIATSKARLIGDDTILTDTGGVYKLRTPKYPSLSPGINSLKSSTVAPEALDSTLVENAEAESETPVEESVSTPAEESVSNEVADKAEIEYDPFKAWLKGMGKPDAPKKPAHKDDSLSISSLPLQSKAGVDVTDVKEAEIEMNDVENLLEEDDDPIVATVVEADVEEPPKMYTPPLRGTPAESSTTGESTQGAESAQAQSDAATIVEEAASEKVEGNSFYEAMGWQGDQDMKTENMEVAVAEKEVEPEDPEDPTMNALMPSMEVREKSMEEDDLMTTDVVKKVSETETAIAKKGTSWLTSLLAKGAATLVNSPVNVNNQFNTVVQYNFGDGKTRNLAQCKSELLIAIAGVDRGLKATKEDSDKIEQLIRAMEAGNPTKSPLKNPLLNGRWALLYTTAKGILGEGNPIRPSGPIYQSIDIFGLRILNEQAYEPVPFVRWTTSAAGDLFPKSNSRAEVKFENYRVGGIKVVAPPTDPARRMIEWELEVSGKGTPAWIDNTYVDENLRVARDHKGNVFVMKRADP